MREAVLRNQGCAEQGQRPGGQPPQNRPDQGRAAIAVQKSEMAGGCREIMKESTNSGGQPRWQYGSKRKILKSGLQIILTSYSAIWVYI